ncbi:MAG: hypothetical protein HOH18_05835 [Kordiimonadaceae bacterium]|jgi:hypothetical protein|nr:hypothetical protein [Kordiimonadaceae bacterium]MBT6035980.1 hypothetical protein [Kordiimonadaceae bacterium]MBT7581614.1 hypothetical protein [Kordiimonadaceae bacterium]
MHIKNRIVTALIILFVFSGQTLAAADLNFCDMDMEQMSMGQMDCCPDDTDCSMDCSLSMVSVLSGNNSFEAVHASSVKIITAKVSTFSRPLNSLFRPPITR